MKVIIPILFSVIAISLVYCKTIGQRLDAGIEHVQHDVEVIQKETGEVIVQVGENLKEAGRIITSPVRYVKNKTIEVLDSAGQKVKYVVSSTRNAAGEVVEDAARSLQDTGRRIKGDGN